MSVDHSPQCTCAIHHDPGPGQAEKELHLQLSDNSRRDFIKKAGRLGLGLGIGGGLVTTPLAAAAMQDSDAAYKATTMQQNKAVQNGKASMLILLHIADIHS